MRFIALSLSVFFCCKISLAQNPDIIWSKTYGGSSWENAFSVQQTFDKGFIVGGYSESNDGDVTGYTLNSSYDGWLVKLDSDGNIQWEEALGGNWTDEILVVKQVPDSGFIVAGESQSSQGDFSTNHGSSDAWVVRLDKDGGIVWQKLYGGDKDDVAEDLILTDSGYAFTGYTMSNDGDLAGNIQHGESDFWFVKLDYLGDIVWSKTFGSSFSDAGVSVKKTLDGGYAIGGGVGYDDGDFNNCNWHGNTDFAFIKTDHLGQMEFVKCYGGTHEDAVCSILQSVEGDYFLAGESLSNNGDVTNHHGTTECYDNWLVKTDSEGNLIWERSFGGASNDIPYCTQFSNDNQILIVGNTASNDGDVAFNHSQLSDAWLLKVDTNGNLLWERSYGGTQIDQAASALQSSDGTYVFAGGSFSVDGDLAINKGAIDFWIAKLASSTSIAPIHTNQFNLQTFYHGNDVIRFRDQLASGDFLLTNTLGQTFFITHYNAAEPIAVETAELPRGIYFVSIFQDGVRSAQKIVLQ